MDNSIIPALSAILGTTVGSLITFLTTFLNRRFAMRRDILARDVANREQLYSEFLKDASSYLNLIGSTILIPAACVFRLIIPESIPSTIRPNANCAQPPMPANSLWQ